MKILKLLSITFLLSGFGIGFNIDCDFSKAFSEYEKCFKGDSDYDHDGRIYIKNISILSKDERDKFDDLLDESDALQGVNSILCYKLSDKFIEKKIIFKDKASVTKDGRFIGAMAADVSTMEKSTQDQWIDGCTCPCFWWGILYIQDKNSDTIIQASFVDSFEFSKDGKFAIILFKNGITITFDLYAKKEVVALRDYSKKNDFFDECDQQLEQCCN